MALILPDKNFTRKSKLKLPGEEEKPTFPKLSPISTLDETAFGVETTTPMTLNDKDFSTEDLFGVGKAIIQSVPRLRDKGPEFRGAILRSASAIELSLGRVMSKIAEKKKYDLRPDIVRNVFDEMSNKLINLSEKDKDLSTAGIIVKDPIAFREGIQNPDWIATGIASNAPNLLASIGAGIAGTAIAGPVGGVVSAFGVSAALEGGFAYQDAKEFGLSDEEATAIMAKVGITNGLLEMIPVSRFLNRTVAGGQIKKRIMKQIVKDVVLQSLEEAGTESLQEIVSNAVARSYDENRDLLTGVSESAFFGGLLGLGAGVAGGAVSISDKIKPGLTIEEVKEPEVTLKTLEKLKGKGTIDKQFIEDLSNQPDLKQAEREMIRRMLEDEGPKVDTAKFIEKVQGELLPLKNEDALSGRSSGTYTANEERSGAANISGVQEARYENTTLTPELRGDVINYGEKIYESPIETSAGGIHFSAKDYPNYFAHTRIEDMSHKDRRIIEIQSDLFQKGRLDFEIGDVEVVRVNGRKFTLTRNKFKGETKKIQRWDDALSEIDIPLDTKRDFWGGTQGDFKGRTIEAADGEKITWREAKKALMLAQKKMDKEIKVFEPLEPYRNVWYERIIREEIKHAAQDGKIKLQFPTGETAMKIEGLGVTHDWAIPGTGGFSATTLTQENIKIGIEIVMSAERGWIVTEVLGEGRFEAVLRGKVIEGMKTSGRDFDEGFESFVKDVNAGKLEGTVDDFTYANPEQFDISGKIDTDNPIYRFYEKNVSRYLKRIHPEMKQITDPQGVTWFEIQVKKKEAKVPVEAFKEVAEKREGKFITEEQAENELRKFFTKEETKLHIQDGIIFMPNGRLAWGSSSAGLIKLVRDNGKVHDKELWHETFHQYMQLFVDPKTRTELRVATQDFSKGLGVELRTLKDSEEFMADMFAEHVAESRTFSGKIKQFFEEIVLFIRRTMNAESKINKVFKDIQEGRRPVTPVEKEVGIRYKEAEKPPPEKDVVKKTAEFQEISQSLKEKIKTFFRPSRRMNTRAFSLLGNKDTAVPLFRNIFGKWVKKEGVDIIVEPYAGAYTLGTHSMQDAINNGLKEFHSNIFDKEKYMMVKAVQDGKIENVVELIKKSARKLSDIIYKNSTGKQKELLDEFFKLHPTSYIGSAEFNSFIKEKPIGSQVTVFEEDRKVWAKLFQSGFNAVYTEKVDTLEDAVDKAFINRIGVFGGKGQSLMRINGFLTFEQKIFGKFGMVEGLRDTNKTFKLAKEKGTKIILYNEDGAKMVRDFKTNQEAGSVGFYFDPPYVLSAKVYKEATGLENFESGTAFVDAHKNAFDMGKQGAKLALTNDVDGEYIKTVSQSLRQGQIFAYKEGNTPTSLITTSETGEIVDDFMTKSEKVVAGVREEVARIKAIQIEKELSNLTMSRIRRALGIKDTRKATDEKLDEYIQFLEMLEPGDKMLTDKQMESLTQKGEDFEEFIDLDLFGTKIELITQRELIETYNEFGDILSGNITQYIEDALFPTVDVKEKNQNVRRVVDKADALLTEGSVKHESRLKKFDALLTKAEKSRKKKLTKKEKLKRFVVPQNIEIFKALGGFKVKLTREEVAVVAYLKNFFKKVRRELELDKARKYYVTHLEKPLSEQIARNGIIKGIKNFVTSKGKARKLEELLPINIMLELDNIIGSEKFFRFAQERHDIVDPSSNLRHIMNTYSDLFETKKALDKVLPEGQAMVQLLLKPRTAKWTKRFLQNLKGRGMDSSFRRGKMGWLSKIADTIVDLGYVKLLGLNYWSGLKNLAAGEANSFIGTELNKYLTGKARYLKNPRKVLQLMRDTGLMEGAFYEYVSKGLLLSNKKVRDFLLIMQKAGEFEIRGGILAGEMTAEEWKAGKLSTKRVREIKDLIAVTQGVFTKVDSPLWLQTSFGRLFMQMNRWRITNANLLRRLTVGSYNEIKTGKKLGKNTRALSKAFIMYGIGMYIAYELGRMGHKRAMRVAQSIAETINSVIELITLKPITDAITNNPTFSILKELTFSIQELANYIHVPGAEEPRSLEFLKGIEETYIAPIERTKEVLGIEDTDLDIDLDLDLDFGELEDLKLDLKL